MTKKAISELVNSCYRILGLKETVIFADRLMYTGFRFATSAGISASDVKDTSQKVPSGMAMLYCLDSVTTKWPLLKQSELNN